MFVEVIRTALWLVVLPNPPWKAHEDMSRVSGLIQVVAEQFIFCFHFLLGKRVAKVSKKIREDIV